MDIYLATIRITILILAITAVDSLANSMVDKRRRLMTAVTCITIAFSAVGEAIGVATNGADDILIATHRMSKLAEFCFAPAIGVAAGLAYGDPVKPKLAAGLVVAHGIFQIIAMEYGLVFIINENNIYDRQGFYWVYVMTFAATLLYGFGAVFRRARKYQVGGHGPVLIMIFIFLITGISIQFIFSGIRIDYLCIALANLFLAIEAFRSELMVDAQTRLLNRRCYEARLEKLKDKAAIIYFDLDDFKAVNDIYGHSQGDECLKKTADILRKVYSGYGSCYRLGGDEFCVLLDRGIENAETRGLEFKKELELVRAQDERMPDISWGYALYDAEKEHMQKVIEDADSMLYFNKSCKLIMSGKEDQDD